MKPKTGLKKMFLSTKKLSSFYNKNLFFKEKCGRIPTIYHVIYEALTEQNLFKCYKIATAEENPISHESNSKYYPAQFCYIQQIPVPNVDRCTKLAKMC